ncbi:hypothetical protein Raf01_91540 [Rugosimonospora africana]|uniref:Uncharacterized protein n=1 Tax=Rugosimonospora africana TaxID=556532 RepID=A0A8J3VVS6_9ACTN|nr:hypothetical protein Raf01_91540 [Rugosimonospora africana]
MPDELPPPLKAAITAPTPQSTITAATTMPITIPTRDFRFRGGGGGTGKPGGGCWGYPGCCPYCVKGMFVVVYVTESVT